MLDTIFITIHIMAGIVAVASGLIAALSKSVNMSHDVHVRSGQAFHIGMIVIFLTALGLVVSRSNLPMFFISGFSVYFAWMGWRYAKNRRGEATQGDQIVTGGFLLFCAIMIGYGVYSLANGNLFGNVIIPFAIIGVINGYEDFKYAKNGGVRGKERIATHLSRMLGGLIATITAVVVVNVQAPSLALGVLLWLAPTIILTPVILYWDRKIKGGTKRKGMSQKVSG